MSRLPLYQIRDYGLEKKRIFAQSGEKTNRQLPISRARVDVMRPKAELLRRYAPVKKAPIVIITAPIAAGVLMRQAIASDIQKSIQGIVCQNNDGESQKNVLTRSPKIPVAIKPNIHFTEDISAPMTMNLASMSFRKSLISWRTLLISWRKPVSSFSKSFLTEDSYSRRSALVANSAASCEFLTAIEKAFACASGTPASLSVSTNCNVSNATAPIASTSCLQILAQDFLCDGYTRKAANEGEYGPWSVA
ncbi:hypothetical protein EBME_1158 [bacterium endosymbiont of Mortierella elongata FMR23-6]|nr:hypothetical protein EBME_1158 [bacterium endosymbiont of Mortierella elongata FMR23-6]